VFGKGMLLFYAVVLSSLAASVAGAFSDGP
jgi:hypothetical protein